MGTALFWLLLDQSGPPPDWVVISGDKGHHLARVLRVRAGEQGVVVADGIEHRVEVSEVVDGTVKARVLERRPVGGEPPVAVTLLQAVLPNPDFDAVIEAVTAVGVSQVIAVQAARSIAHPGSSRLRRWQTIAVSAAEQSHRGRAPEVRGPTSLSAALEEVRRTSRLLALDPQADTPLIAVASAPAYALAIGPEGGWTDEERSLMRERGGIEVHLGARILRARLAPIVAAAILVQRS
jgi:16S rRNA (uracil1498-N3)-methyltransferase